MNIEEVEEVKVLVKASSEFAEIHIKQKGVMTFWGYTTKRVLGLLTHPKLVVENK